MNDKLKYSIIVPTYNEEEDIENTISHLLSLNYDNYDIIIVDDSDDNTPNIIKKFASDKIKLIIPTTRRGRSEARNIGIKASSSDVVIILNADVHLPANFIIQINNHYKNGYDAVCVLSTVKNTDSMFARYVELDFLMDIDQGFYKKSVEELKFFWTEGFSVRRNLLIKTSLFPSNEIVPIVAGEDVRLIDELRKYKCNGIYDDDIKVKHISPSIISDFWNVRMGRGEGTPQVRKFLDNWPLKKIALITFLKSFRRLALFILIFPIIFRGYQLSKHSYKNSSIEIALMSYAYVIEQTAMTIGEYKSLLNIYRKRKHIK